MDRLYKRFNDVNTISKVFHTLSKSVQVLHETPFTSLPSFSTPCADAKTHCAAAAGASHSLSYSSLWFLQIFLSFLLLNLKWLYWHDHWFAHLISHTSALDCTALQSQSAVSAKMANWEKQLLCFLFGICKHQIIFNYQVHDWLDESALNLKLTVLWHSGCPLQL